jgi:hypothetical protein
MATTVLDFAGQVLADVQREIAVDDDVLSETKARRNLVKRHARSFPGALKTFDSGSVAHGTVNKPVSDADGGVVLDRRTYPKLGPDGDGVGPNEIVGEVAAHVLAGVREDYPDATCRVCKRAILVEFNAPLASGEDPSVDLIVALTRADCPGRWIPNTEAHDWDASDPEEHTRLLNGTNTVTRVHRARVIRLAKAAVKQDATPVVSSFNLEALALEYVDAEDTISVSLRDLFLGAAGDLSQGLTPDPAGVSDPIKLPDGVPRAAAVARLQRFGECVATAISADTLEEAEAALAELYPDHIGSGAGARQLGAALALGINAARVRSAFGPGVERVKPSRAYGDPARRGAAPCGADYREAASSHAAR